MHCACVASSPPLPYQVRLRDDDRGSGVPAGACIAFCERWLAGLGSVLLPLSMKPEARARVRVSKRARGETEVGGGGLAVAPAGKGRGMAVAAACALSVKAMRRGSRPREDGREEEADEEPRWDGEAPLGNERRLRDPRPQLLAPTEGKEEEDRLERDHFRRIINAFRYYG